MGVKPMDTICQKIRKYTEYRIQKLLKSPENAARASMARLRRGIGHTPGDLPELWSEFLLDLPEEFYGHGTEISRAEWAIYTALTMFALHQQSKSRDSEPMHKPGISLGRAAGMLIENEEDRERIARRFYPAATAEDMTELSHHLRGLISLLRSNGIPMDYAQLAADLFLFQNPDAADRVKLRWGEDFCYIQSKSDNNEQDNQKEKGN